MSNDRDFLGSGLRFPVSVNLNGGVSSSQLEENVRQSIFIILGTAPGERLRRPQLRLPDPRPDVRAEQRS